MLSEKSLEAAVEAVCEAMRENRVSRLHHDAVRAVLKALAEEGYVIEQGWRTIETAPRDGRRVLLAVKSASENNGWYGRNPPEVDGYEMFKWLKDGWSTPGSGGWADFFFKGWRPLPEPPLSAHEDGK